VFVRQKGFIKLTPGVFVANQLWQPSLSFASKTRANPRGAPVGLVDSMPFPQILD